MWPSLHKYWLVIAIIAASAAMFGAIWANGHSRMALLTVAMVPDLFADMPVSVLKIVGEEPLREEVTIPGPHGPIVADVYRPAMSIATVRWSLQWVLPPVSAITQGSSA